jgi:hypothetical protein
MKEKREEYNGNLGRAHEFEADIAMLKLQLKASVQKQLDHYHNLLAEGKDIRKKGLSWVLRIIWQLEKQQTTPARFPKYMDDESKQCLIDVSKDSRNPGGQFGGTV